MGVCMNRKFRLLKAEEIELRVGTCTEKGFTLLLYKDARCDMNILDETVGAMNWKREHTRDNKNCVVSIYDEDKKEWVSKEDTGSESNTEADKGLASDSFKRACVNWGIGRELYTAPFIWVNADGNGINIDCKEFGGKKRYSPRARDLDLKVAKIAYNENGEIENLAIFNKGKMVFCTR